MTTSQPTPPQAAPASYWQAPNSRATEDQILPWFRTHFVALTAALVVQATVAFLGVLPEMPLQPALSEGYYSQTPMFWMQFAMIEFIAAAVIALGFRPCVRLGDLPLVARLVLGLGFVVLPAAALVLGGIDVARAAAGNANPVTVASTWLATAVFGTLFFGLPLLALVAPTGRATVKPA